MSETMGNQKTEKRHLSATQIGMYLRCPAQYRFRYVEGLKILPSGAMVQSRVWHETLERNYKQKIGSEIDLSVGEMQEFFAARLDETFDNEEIALKPGENHGKLKDQGTAIVAVHHKAIAPSVRPLLVEERFTVDLGADFPFDLVGVWDLVEKDGTVADNKAYKRAPSQEDIDRDLQLTCYSLAHRVTKGWIEPRLRLDIVTKTATPKAIQLYTKRSNADCRWFLDLVEQVAQAIVAEVFYPNPNNYLCSPRWCGFWSRCKK